MVFLLMGCKLVCDPHHCDSPKVLGVFRSVEAAQRFQHLHCPIQHGADAALTYRRNKQRVMTWIISLPVEREGILAKAVEVSKSIRLKENGP